MQILIILFDLNAQVIYIVTWNKHVKSQNSGKQTPKLLGTL